MTDHMSDSLAAPDKYPGTDGYGTGDQGDYDDRYGSYYDDEDRADIENLRPAPEVEGRTSWAYLGLLSGLFVLLVGFSWACNDRSDEIAGEGPAATPGEVEGRLVRLSVSIDAEVVVLSGNVPDEAARGQVVAAAQVQYGAENVVDELEIVESSQLDGGTVSISGRADADDPRPENLRVAIVGDFGLEEANFSVARGDAALVPVEVQAEASADTVRLSGQVPDQASIDELTAAAEQVWGQGNVDNSDLSIADTTWADGRVVVTGAATVGFSAEAFPAAVRAGFGPSVVVDIEGLEVDTSTEALGGVEEQINADLAAQPILFAPESAEIDDSSDEILTSVAETLNTLPGVAVEVVGHTDNVGNEEENQALSQQRAEAVIARLVELGVDADRLNGRGEGSRVPIADNSTDQGREQNRRIEFALVGSG